MAIGWVGLGRVQSNMREREFSAVSRTITDVRSRLSPKTVEAMELIRWAVRGSQCLTWMTNYLI